MPTRTETEQQLRDTLGKAAGSLRVEDRWDELVYRVESGNEREPVIVAPPRGHGRRWKPAVVFAAAFVAVVVVIGSSALLGGRSPQADPTVGGGTEPEPIATEPASATTFVEPAVVWPPSLPTVEGQTEAVWHCPEIDDEPTIQLDPFQVPDELRYLPAGGEPVRTAFGNNYGLGCSRSPALVAVTFAKEQQSAISAAVVVWVEQPTREHAFREPSAGQNSARRPGDSITVVDGFTIKHSTIPNVEPPVDDLEAVGVLDGLPVWIEASGITPDRLLELTEEMTANPESGQVQLAETVEGFVVMHSGPVQAVVTDRIVWHVEGPGIGQSLDVSINPGFNPYAKAYSVAVAYPNLLQFVQVGGTTALAGGEEGGTQQIDWEIQPGIQANVSGDYGTELVQIAESLTQVSANDPRLPTD